MSVDSIISTALGIIGILTGYIFFIKGKRIKEACWTIDDFMLIKGYSSLVKDLKIQYRGKTIENLTVSKVVFWNNGNEVINGADIKTALPLRIHAVDDVEILNVEILKISNPANLFVAEPDEDNKSTRLMFDYLNSNEGAVIQVIHTGVSLVNVLVRGQIKGVKEIKYKGRERDDTVWITRLMSYVSNSILWFPVFLWILFPSFRGPNNAALWIWIALAVVVTSLTVLYQVRWSRSIARLPKDLS